MFEKLEEFSRGLLTSIELYLELEELREIGLSEEEILGWLEMYADEYLRLQNEHIHSG